MPINAMISSTVTDLLPDREAAGRALRATGIVELVGVVPARTPAMGSSPYLTTVDIAASCDLYVLILGRRYGYETELGHSATEVEYLAAYKADPTKVIVLEKNVRRIEPKQKAFKAQVADYHKGYFINRYSNSTEVEQIMTAAFQVWIEERAAIGRGLNYFDHFIRLAIQRLPFPNVHPEYAVTASTLQFTYRLPDRVESVHFEKSHIFNDFWGSLLKLERSFERWRIGV